MESAGHRGKTGEFRDRDFGGGDCAVVIFTAVGNRVWCRRNEAETVLQLYLLGCGRRDGKRLLVVPDEPDRPQS